MTTEEEYRAAVEYFNRQSRRSLTNDVQATRRHLRALNEYTGPGPTIEQHIFNDVVRNTYGTGRHISAIRQREESTPPTHEDHLDAHERYRQRLQEDEVYEHNPIPVGSFQNPWVGIRDDTCMGEGLDHHETCLDLSGDYNKVLASVCTFDKVGLVVTWNGEKP